MADSKKYNGSTWQHSLRKLTTATEAVENPLYSDGTAITAYTIKGNTVQNGTPTPSNPVEVNGVGVRTENLFPTTTNWYRNNSSDPSRTEDLQDTRIKSDIVPISGDGETISVATFNMPDISGLALLTLRFFDSAKTEISSGLPPIAIPSGAKFISLLYGNVAGGITDATKSQMQEAQIMVVYGNSTPTDYEPYGYKIPISNDQQTIDIYIGDLPLLKSLDGTAVDEINNGTLTRRVDSDGSVLPTPTTTQITMPSIPTTDGANTITVDTTVQPSEFTATWTGWHNASVKEKSENLFDVTAKDTSRGYIVECYLYSDGTIATNKGGYQISEYIPIDSDTSYALNYGSILNMPAICFYDANYNYISGIQYNRIIPIIFQTPSNAAFCRFSMEIVLENDVMLNTGSTALPYEPYWK